MDTALEVLRLKGHKISKREAEAVCAGILLHDIGHGPFSHTLENCIIPEVSHEFLSSVFMAHLNKIFSGRLSLAIEIFQKKYKKQFLHQLISSQLDLDRLDYLKRDSFFTGVQEGVIGHDRIIKMLEIKNDQLVVEEKGIYSIEKFLVARRLMYWQVYLHKTVLCAEQLLVKIMQRAKELVKNKIAVDASEPLQYFLKKNITRKMFLNDNEPLQNFAKLDDVDVMAAVKSWTQHHDRTLSLLSQNLIERHLFRIEMQNGPFSATKIEKLKKIVKQKYDLESLHETEYFVFTSSTSNHAYNPDEVSIKILYKDGSLKDIAKASDQMHVSFLSAPVVKYYLCYPKEIVI